jgi:hypothetical protein
MNNRLILILHVVLLVGGVIIRLLDLMGDVRPPVAPSNHYYIIVPDQPHAAAKREEPAATQTWSM